MATTCRGHACPEGTKYHACMEGPKKGIQPKECMNCANFGWRCDMSKPKMCSRCKLVPYCSNICQLEHYNKVHHKHCKYLAGIKVREKSVHQVENCPKCQIVETLPADEFANPSSSAYPCIFIGSENFHTFFTKKNPSTDQMQLFFPGGANSTGGFWPTNLGEISGKFTSDLEQCLSVLTHICVKLLYITPHKCVMDLKKITKSLMLHRLSGLGSLVQDVTFRKHIFHIQDIWKSESTQKGIVEGLSLLYSDYSKPSPNQTEEVDWWASLKVFLEITQKSFLFGYNSADEVKFRSSVKPVLDSVSVKMIPYKDLLRTMCRGKTETCCSSCEKPITVKGFCIKTDLHPPGALVSCGPEGLKPSCRDCFQAGSVHQEDPDHQETKFHSAQDTRTAYPITREDQAAEFKLKRDEAAMKNWILCDNCFERCRSQVQCAACKSKCYCSEVCLEEDWTIHEMFCGKIQEAADKGELGRRKIVVVVE